MFAEYRGQACTKEPVSPGGHIILECGFVVKLILELALRGVPTMPRVRRSVAGIANGLLHEDIEVGSQGCPSGHPVSKGSDWCRQSFNNLGKEKDVSHDARKPNLPLSWLLERSVIVISSLSAGSAGGDSDPARDAWASMRAAATARQASVIALGLGSRRKGSNGLG